MTETDIIYILIFATWTQSVFFVKRIYVDKINLSIIFHYRFCSFSTHLVPITMWEEIKLIVCLFGSITFTQANKVESIFQLLTYSLFIKIYKYGYHGYGFNAESC